MSDNYVHVIPERPGFVPGKMKRDAAVCYFRVIAPKADEVGANLSRELTFVHAGGNFGKIRCPACEKEVDVALWQEWMNEDFVEAGFKLQAHEMPCCGMKYTLHELAYEWPQGFARCDIYAMNPRMGRISTARRRRFAELLGCAVRVVYEHI